jgi:SAM-dependent methyltransferase
VLRDAWEDHAAEWVAWARAPGHDSYWRFHRDAFLSIVPAPGRLTLDVGCGEGRLSRDLSVLGHRVVGIDASPTMLNAAAGHSNSACPFVLADAARLPVRSEAADCVIAFMSLQDVDELEAAIAELGRTVVPGGHLLMAVTHPANTAGRFAPDPEDAAPPFVIEGSWFERRRFADTCERGGYTMTFHSEHRPLQVYADALADGGFLIERIREVGDPDPADRWSRIPLFLHIRAVRRTAHAPDDDQVSARPDE